MKLFLLRHGDRNSGYGDVPLSPEGLRQAQHIADSAALSSVELILCSPKLRTKQTVEPLAARLGLTVQIELALDQQKSIETQGEFTRRVMEALSQVPQAHAGKTVLLCTHSDWLQTAVLAMPSPRTDNAIHCFFSCGEFKSLTFKDGSWEIQA